jgi:UDP-2,3-diacylglucosamine hydrolase
LACLFVSDLHLDPARPQITRLFEHFLAGEARAAEAVYILGDLFEAWIGDDDDRELPARVVRALRALVSTGVPTFFIAGNRDFLLGADYAARAGMRLLPDASVHTIAGVPTLLMHGDALCTDDRAYLAFRDQVRAPEWQRQFLAQALDARRAFAAQARAGSRAHIRDTPEVLMDVNVEAVASAMRKAGVRRLIHGHTHRPAVHRFMLDAQPAERIVLGDWYEQGSRLRVAAGSLALDSLDPTLPAEQA